MKICEFVNEKTCAYLLIDKLYRNYQIYRNSFSIKKAAICKRFTSVFSCIEGLIKAIKINIFWELQLYMLWDHAQKLIASFGTRLEKAYKNALLTSSMTFSVFYKNLSRYIGLQKYSFIEASFQKMSQVRLIT